MNSRQRVLTALRRDGIPDRVPIQFDLCRSLLEAFGTKYGIPVDYTPSYYEDLMYRSRQTTCALPWAATVSLWEEACLRA